jgi:hypothetical protein
MVFMDLLMLDSYNRDDMDIEIIQTSLDKHYHSHNKQLHLDTLGHMLSITTVPINSFILTLLVTY